MNNDKWGIVALENGNVEAGQLSKMYLMGEGVIQVKCPVTNTFYSHHKFNAVKGIRMSSEEEIVRIYKKLNNLK